MLQQLPSDVRKHILSFLRENATLLVRRATGACGEGSTFELELFRYHTRCFCMLVFSRPRAESIPVFQVPIDVLKYALCAEDTFGAHDDNDNYSVPARCKENCAAVTFGE